MVRYFRSPTRAGHGASAIEISQIPGQEPVWARRYLAAGRNDVSTLDADIDPRRDTTNGTGDGVAWHLKYR